MKTPSLSPEQKDFESKYLHKIVKPRGLHYKNIPIKEYIVTAALLNWENNGQTTIFSIKALDYTLENRHWMLFHVGVEEFDKCMGDFEIIRDGYEEYVKPKILEESLLTFVGEDGDNWLAYFSKYFVDGKFIKDKPKTEYLKIPKNKELDDRFIGLNQYLFLYKSVYNIDKPSLYVFPIPPNLDYVQDIISYVEPIRQKILDNKIVRGMDLSNSQNTKDTIN